MEMRMGEGALVDVQFRDSVVSKESSCSEGRYSDPERGDTMKTPVKPFAVKEEERPNPEVPAKAQRRRFSAQYKKKILEEADACKGSPGGVGSLLRREGLYSSHLTTWRRQRDKGELDGLTPKKRGRKAKPANPLARKTKELEAENRRLKKQLEKAETIISFQKKLSEMLGISLNPKENDETC